MKHRAVIIGAGRIGAGYHWQDMEYTHAGAYQALRDRVELVGFIEPDYDRSVTAKLRWHLPVYEELESIAILKPDIISICTQPEQQESIFKVLATIPGIKGVWCEKPLLSPIHIVPTQVNYMRRGDPVHQRIANEDNSGLRLIVYAKDDIHTRCHFEDLAAWWRVPLNYYPIKEGPCSYILGSSPFQFDAFPEGGVDGGKCFKAMLGNLLDHIDTDGNVPLWSAAR